MILVYPSTMPGRPMERHTLTQPLTIAEWSRQNVDGLSIDEKPKFVCSVNNTPIPPSMWETFVIHPDDRVNMAPRPGVSGTMALVIATVVSIAASYFLRPSIPNLNSKQSLQGQELYGANARANTAKRDAVIPEIAGRVRRCGDYTTPQHKWFADRRTQWVEFLMLIGKGHYEIKPEEIFINETPGISLGDDFAYEIFPPGADVSGNSASQHWHSATEVGSTSTGAGGLDLTTTIDLTQTAAPSSFRAAGRTLMALDGKFPDDWTSGLDVVIQLGLQYEFFETESGQSAIRGNNLPSIGAYPGMQLEIIGDNEGRYVVDRVVAAVPEQPAIPPDPEDPDDTGTPAVPAVAAYITLNDQDGNAVDWLETGTKTAAIGLAGFIFRTIDVSENSITVERRDINQPTGFTWEGWGSATSTQAAITLDVSSYTGDWAGWYSSCPKYETTRRSQISIYWPQGLYHMSSKGKIQSKTSGIEIQWRDQNDPDRKIYSIERWFEAASRDAIGETFDIDHAADVTPEVRIRALPVDHDDTKDMIKMQWSGLCSLLKSPSKYEGATVVAIRVRGGQRLSAQSESQISVICTRELPPIDDPDGDLVSTRDIAPWIAHVLRTAGYEQDDIDIPELQRLHAIWSSRGELIDRLYDEEITVQDTIEEAMQVGFARMRIDEGLLQPIRDEKRDTVNPLMFGPQSSFEELERTFTAPDASDYTGIDVTYNDGVTGSTAVVKCRIPGIDADKIEKITLKQCSDRTQAYRVGMRRLGVYVYRREQYKAVSGLAGLNANVLDLVELADDVPGYEQTAFLEDIEQISDSQVRLTVSEPLSWSDDSVHVIKIMGSDGRRAAVVQATQTDDPYQLLVPPLDISLDLSGDVDLPHVFFGPVTRCGRRALISSVTFDGDLVGEEEPTSTITAENDAMQVYAYDDAEPDDA